MMFAKTLTFVCTLLASSFVAALPIDKTSSLAERDVSSSGWSSEFESPAVYQSRYNELDCMNQYDTPFFTSCCQPLLAGQDICDSDAQCIPSSVMCPANSGVPALIVRSNDDCTDQEDDQTGEDDDTEDDTEDDSCGDDEEDDDDDDDLTVPSTDNSTSVVPSSTTPSPTNATSITSTPTPAATPSDVGTSSNTTTPSTTPDTEPSSSDSYPFQGGFATYFYQNGNAGACGNYNSDSSYVAAITPAQWGNTDELSPNCGRQIQIRRTDTGATVVVVAADMCPTCANDNSIDLSVGAFTSFATEDEGSVPMEWEWIS